MLSPLRFKSFSITMKMIKSYFKKSTIVQKANTCENVRSFVSVLVSQQRVISKCKHPKESLALICLQL